MSRMVRIGTTAFCHPDGERESRERTLTLANLAGRAGCDLLLLPEHFYRGDDGQACSDRASQQRLEEALQGVALKHHMYVIGGLPYYEGDACFNAAILYDRQGEARPLYYKVHPTEGELKRGIVPGGPPVAFDLDFGRLGALICFDIGWPAEWRMLKEQGAELVCWLSAYDGGFPLQAHAWYNRYHVVSSVRSTNARFVDVTGRVTASTSRYTPLAIEEVNLDRRVFEIDTDFHRLPAIRERYGDAVRIEGYGEEDLFALESLDEGLSTEQIIAEFGLETYDAYHERSGRLQQQARAAWESGESHR
ncbi:MAG: carbon-nitrogen hydrolase family protein [Anaerolineae bacterium]